MSEKVPPNMMHHLNEKLFLPWSLDGEPNLEYLDFLTRTAQDLKEKPGFVAVGGYGSKFKGYAVDTSDNDVLAIIDTEKADNLAVAGIVQKNSHDTDRVVSLITIPLKDINFEIHNENADYFRTLAVLAHYLIGNTGVINELREELKAKHQSIINELPRFAAHNFYQALTYLMKYDIGANIDIDDEGEVKINTRSHDMPTNFKMSRRDNHDNPLDMKQLTENRVKLWAERLNGMLGTQYELCFPDK